MQTTTADEFAYHEMLAHPSWRMAGCGVARRSAAAIAARPAR
ncbi:MAG: hypothetical protein R3D25_02770 [Geminicoccaceae bacterium]